MKKIKQRFYSTEDIKWNTKDGWHYEELPDRCLYAHTENGRTYPTKIKAKDLPKWYVYGRYYKRWGYLSAKGVVHMRYEPMYTNHFLKDDCLYISYSGEISDEDIKMYNCDFYIWGNEIIDFLLAAEKYSDYDIADLKRQIEDKREWLRFNEPEIYKWCKEDLWGEDK